MVVWFKINLFCYGNFLKELDVIKFRLRYTQMKISEEQEVWLKNCFEKICRAKDLNIETVASTSELRDFYDTNDVLFYEKT